MCREGVCLYCAGTPAVCLKIFLGGAEKERLSCVGDIFQHTLVAFLPNMWQTLLVFKDMCGAHLSWRGEKKYVFSHNLSLKKRGGENEKNFWGGSFKGDTPHKRGG
jgi:hypothetical protein